MSRQTISSTAQHAAADAPATLLQRKCACGKGASALTGECEECQQNMALGLQTRLSIGASDDPLEGEADRAAAQVLHMNPANIGTARAASPVLSRRGTGAHGGHRDAVPDSVHHTLRCAGEPLTGSARAYFEPRFGHDFGKVRVHRDALAARSARDVEAYAYTVGHSVVFGRGQYAPDALAGRELLAHELAHVIQQSGTRGGTLQRATIRQGRVSITIDYSGLTTVPAADRADRIVALATSLTGLSPDPAQDTAIRALTASEQNWLMHSLKLLSDNTAAASTLDWAVAIQRLLDQASRSSLQPLPDPGNRYVREVLRVSGWSETAQAQRLSAPGSAGKAAIDRIVNPPPTTGSASDPLDVAALNARLPPALTHLLNRLDPASWTNVDTRSLSAFQAIGDVVQREARSFFAPYADAAIDNLYDLQPRWHASANIFDVGALTPTTDQRLSYLSNRAEIVGRSTAVSASVIDANIFADVHFDPTRPADQAELFSIVSTMDLDPAIAPIVDRLIQHTGRKTGSRAATRIGLVTEFNADRATACEDHWAGIDTLCHEVLHALVHADFVATAGRVSFPQVIREGFTEVLGVQLFNDRVVPKAKANPTFKATLEAGVSGAPCPAPAAATIGYGSAGSGAESIRRRVGNENFRAAYFLGRPELAGLPR
ncbi:DUF4157 domain-containing protein [Halomonas sp. HK25]|uniref:eCIS core domain-containing protein n=1 Tax=Halomonas sp. HK25 TaxID=3394321 RepID=UPI0039FCC432